MIRRTRRSTRKDTLLPYTTLFRSDSRKGTELAANAHVALLFHWKSLRRQIRIEGPVVPVDDATADAYFATRSRDSQLGAWASDQRSEEHTSELQSLMRISYAVFCLTKKIQEHNTINRTSHN